MSACFGDVLFSSKTGACEKVESSFWLFPPVFVDLQFVFESFQVRFHLLDSFWASFSCSFMVSRNLFDSSIIVRNSLSVFR